MHHDVLLLFQNMQYLPTIPLTFRRAPFGSTKVISTKTSDTVGVAAGEAAFAKVAAVDEVRRYERFSDSNL
jgi:hypothetical protein